MPKQLGKYQIIEPIGEGMMGFVYRGFDTEIQRIVALKTLKASIMDDEHADEVLLRFKREAHVAGTLNHKNIVTIYEYGESNDIPFIAMEFIRGQTLEHLDKLEEKLNLRKKIRIITQVLDALAFSHKHGIVHRDIKPSNIMLLNTTQDVKVADFGIARFSNSDITQMGAILGTPAYMSPEQVMGQRVDSRSDLFSTAVILYYLLTGVNPFKTKGIMNIMQNILNKEVPPPSTVNPEVPVTFDSILEIGLNKDAGERFTNAVEFKKNLINAYNIREKSQIFSMFSKTKKITVDDSSYDLDTTLIDYKLRQIDNGELEPEFTASQGIARIKATDNAINQPTEDKVTPAPPQTKQKQEKKKDVLFNINRFEVIHELGKGSQGVVYLAYDPNLQRHVSIKTLARKGQDIQTEKLLHEARMVSHLMHPNIIPVFESGEYDDIPYLVFEYMQGITLRNFLNNENKLSIKRAINLTTQLLDAIYFAHDRGVLHCDLNPANILIGDKDMPRIMDFGVARLQSSFSNDSENLVGTPRYMAPENFNEMPLGAFSDIYSIGLIFFEMITGHLAVSEMDYHRVVYIITQGEIPKPSFYNASISPELDEIVSKMLAVNPEDRYQEAQEAKIDLENLLAGQDQSLVDEDDGARSTIKFLLHRMERKKDFPSMSHHLIEINKLASEGDNWSIDKLVGAISKDYSLTNKLLRLVNTSRYTEHGGEISTVEKAVQLLGFEKVYQISLGTFVFDKIQDKNKAQLLQNVMLKSWASGMVARKVSEYVRSENAEEAFICALFYDLGKVLSIFYFNEEYLEIQKMADEAGMSENDACREVLLLTYDKLALGVCENWKLPQKLMNGIVHLPEGELSEPKSETEIINVVSGFSNELCDLVMVPKGKSKDEIVDLLTQRFEQCLPINEIDIPELINYIAGDIKKEALILGLTDLEKNQFVNALIDWQQNPESEEDEDEDEEIDDSMTIIQSIAEIDQSANVDVELLPDDDLFVKNSQPEPKPDIIEADKNKNKPVLKKSVVKKSVVKKAIISNTLSLEKDVLSAKDFQMMLILGLRFVKESIKAKQSLEQLIPHILSIIHKAFSCQHAFYCDIQKRTVSAEFGEGENAKKIIKHFTFKVERKADIFNECILFHKAIHIEDLSDKETHKFLPVWYRKLIRARSVSIYPILLDNATFGLIYIDSLETIKNKQYQALFLKAFCEQISYVINSSRN